MIRGVAYFRMSGLRQEASIPDQRKWAKDACAREGVEIVKDFEDPGVPGSEIEQRPGLMKLLAFCEDRFMKGQPVECLVCWDADRFSRANSIKTAVCISRLLDSGVNRLLSADGWLDW